MSKGIFYLLCKVIFSSEKADDYAVTGNFGSPTELGI